MVALFQPLTVLQRGLAYLRGKLPRQGCTKRPAVDVTPASAHTGRACGVWARLASLPRILDMQAAFGESVRRPPGQVCHTVRKPSRSRLTGNGSGHSCLVAGSASPDAHPYEMLRSLEAILRRFLLKWYHTPPASIERVCSLRRLLTKTRRRDVRRPDAGTQATTARYMLRCGDWATAPQYRLVRYNY